MDKTWINLVNRISDDYINGLENFLDFAFSKRPLGAKEIYCPCRDCSNRYHRDRATVKLHCIEVGFDKDYKNWTSHGEKYVSHRKNQNNDLTNDEGMDAEVGVHDMMRQMVHEGMGVPITNIDQPALEEIVQSDDATAKFLKLLRDAEKPLWEGCDEFTILSFIVELMHWKASFRVPDKGFTSLLQIFIRALPKSAKVPKSYREAYKMTADLGFGYKTWDACENHCMLFRNETSKLDKCEICGAYRYKQQNEEGIEEGSNASKCKKVAKKKVWYFPLKPRLQRLYWSSKTASLMRWHAEERIDDGVLRHPTDSRAWKEFDKCHPSFSSEARNVRLGLASDGFNPFSTMTISHSTWPVVLMPYNLPPWLCMKQPYFFLSVLIQGPKGPGNKIDVYLQPLIEELRELWDDGISTYDASKNEMFTLRASLMWTINDFPAYANLSGWSTKGEYACPCCNIRPQAHWLINGGKWCYIGHRRFLQRTHNFRKEKSSFDGFQEVRAKPKFLSGSEVLKQVENMETEYKVHDVFKKRNREDDEKQQAKLDKRKVPKACHNWKKKSIFFELPYWKDNLVRHNLDVMHIEKNVCDNLLYTLLGTSGKTKDNLKARHQRWADLITKWGSEKSKEISQINKENRSKQEFLNRTGKKSHPALRKEREDQGMPTDRLSMFIATRTGGSGQTMDRTTAHIIEKLNDAISELPEEERNSPSQREKVFIENLGKDGHGCMRCMGRGVTKTMVFGKAATSETVAAVRAEFEEKLESQKLAMEADFSKRLQAEVEKKMESFVRSFMERLHASTGFVFSPM